MQVIKYFCSVSASRARAQDEKAAKLCFMLNKVKKEVTPPPPPSFTESERPRRSVHTCLHSSILTSGAGAVEPNPLTGSQPVQSAQSLLTSDLMSALTRKKVKWQKSSPTCSARPAPPLPSSPAVSSQHRREDVWVRAAEHSARLISVRVGERLSKMKS